jgi:hypothetical protein
LLKLRPGILLIFFLFNIIGLYVCTK